MYDLSYINWKAWSQKTINNNGTTEEYYKKICKVAKVGPGSEVLEVGFGNANFLEFGSRTFKKIIGVEANLLLVDKFKGDYEVHGSEYIACTDERFDCIILFDVLEHIERDELVSFIGSLIALLKTNGVIVARFPNGDSPLNCLNYNSDLTHRLCIGSGIINFICTKYNLKIKYAGADPTPIIGCKFVTVIHRLFSQSFFLAIDLIFKLLYLRWGAYSVTSVNALVILSR